MKATQPELVFYEERAAVAVLTFNRPERLNAFTPVMHRQYRELLARAEASADVGAIVVTGAGRGFCAGADGTALGEVADSGDGYPSKVSRAGGDRPGYGVHPDFDRPFAYHLGLTKPVVAAINGPTAGLGLVLACYCDVRFAAADVKMTTGFGPLGLPVEYGLSWLLPRLIGGSRAHELLLSSRVFTSEEAATLGLVHRVVPGGEVVDVAVAYAQDMVRRCSGDALAATKRQMYLDMQRDLGAAYDDSMALADAATRTAGFREGVAALRERRPPVFVRQEKIDHA